MRFSLRELLAVTFLVGLGLLVWRVQVDTRRNEAVRTHLRSEVLVLQARLFLDQPELHQSLLHTRDEYESLAAMRQRAVEHFAVLRDKYGTLVPREPGVLSLRGVPSLAEGGGTAPATFRLLVPADRPVWLKCGVHRSGQSAIISPNRPDADLALLAHSPFDASGPFEIELPPGDQVLAITIGTADEGTLPITIALNEQVLLHSTFVSETVTGTSSSHISGAAQLDFPPGQPLPWLVTAQISERNPADQTSWDGPYQCSAWLSDRASGYARFPGE